HCPPPRTRRALMKREPKPVLLLPPNSSQDHLIGCLRLLVRRTFERDFVKLGTMLHRYGDGNGNGIRASSLFRGGCRGGKSNGGGTGKTAYVATFVESAASRS